MKKFGKFLALSLCLALCAIAFAACGGEKPTDYNGTWVRTAEDGYYYLVIKDDAMTTYFATEADFSKAVALGNGTFKLTSRTDEQVVAVNNENGYTNVYTASVTNGVPTLTLTVGNNDLVYEKK